MTTFKLLAASLLVAAAMPAFASDGIVSAPNNAQEFFAQGRQAAPAVRLIEGRNNSTFVTRAQAAIAQGFAPVDTEAAANQAAAPESLGTAAFSVASCRHRGLYRSHR
jgi:hypothetical protein